MFIAHLPAGYIAAHYLRERLNSRPETSRAYLLCALLGAVAPDFDLFYFYLFDHRLHPHHSYFTHFPVLWLLLTGLALLWRWCVPQHRYAPLACIFALNGFVHMVLDTVFGHIKWLAPWSDQSFSLWPPHAIYHPWWLNFFLHWGMAIELLIVLWAAYLWRCQSGQPALACSMRKHP